MLHALARDLTEVDNTGRASDRVAVPYPARVFTVDGDGESTQLTAHLVNLSQCGAALRVYGHPEPDTDVRLIIDLGRVPVVVCARAVWTRTLHHGPMVGLTFDELTTEQHAAIEALLADRK